MSPERVYCIDEGQGFDHKCVDHHSGECSRPGWCRFQMSETLKKHFAEQWNMKCEQIEQSIKNDIAEVLGLRGSNTTVRDEA